jgi:hypothetical protein
MKSEKQYWLLGLTGCALFGVGDWLLGYVDPQPVSEVFGVLKAGHGEDYLFVTGGPNEKNPCLCLRSASSAYLQGDERLCEGVS